MKPLIVIGAIALAACTQTSASEPVTGVASYSEDDARAGAQLRTEASIIIPIIFNPFGSSPAMKATSDRFREFKEGLDHPRQRMDLVIAKADYDYQMSLIDIVCPEPQTSETLEREKLGISVANSVLDRMDALIERKAGQET